MLFGLLLVIPAGFFVYGMVRDRRRLSNAIWLGITLVVLVLAAAEVGQGVPQVGLPLFLLFLLALMSLALLPLALLANGLVMVRREGRSLGNLLSLLAGLALLGAMVYFVWGITQESAWIRGSAVGLFLVSAYVAFLFLSLLLYSVIYGRTGRRRGFDGIVVLGAGLIGDRVPALLASRLERALRVYRRDRAEGRSPVIVVSGGQGADEAVSEAEAMSRYLLERDVPAEDIVREDQATTTEENLRFSKALLAERGLDGRLVAVTNNYHVFRTAVLSRNLGLRVDVIGSPTAWYFVPSAFLREFVALLVRNPVVHGVSCAVLMAGGLALALAA